MTFKRIYTSHDDTAHSPVSLGTHNVMVDDSNTYDCTFTSPTVLEDSSTYDSATHAIVVPSARDQHVIADPTSYDRVRNYSIQYPTGTSMTYYVVCRIQRYPVATNTVSGHCTWYKYKYEYSSTSSVIVALRVHMLIELRN